MPLYEYRCEDCGEYIEKIQKFSDPLLTVCEKCNGKLNKIMSQSSFVLKGAGWYLTDYAKKSSSDAGKASTATTEAPKCEAKPDGGCGAGACGSGNN